MGNIACSDVLPFEGFLQTPGWSEAPDVANEYRPFQMNRERTHRSRYHDKHDADGYSYGRIRNRMHCGLVGNIYEKRGEFLLSSVETDM